jgi:hypothetical protein
MYAQFLKVTGLVLSTLSHYRGGNVMDYESNFGNISRRF